MFTEVARNKNINFEINCDEEQFMAPLHTDRRRLEQNPAQPAFQRVQVYRPRWYGYCNYRHEGAGQVYSRNEKLRGLPQMALFSVTDSGMVYPQISRVSFLKRFSRPTVPQKGNSAAPVWDYLSAASWQAPWAGKFTSAARRGR